jgi:hypothetical protein
MRGEKHAQGGCFRQMQGLDRGERVDEEVWRALTDKDSAPVLVSYTIRRTSLGHSSRQPPKGCEKASLNRLSHTSAEERFGEKLHMSEKSCSSSILTQRLIRPVLRLSTRMSLAGRCREKAARVEVDAVQQRVPRPR